MADNRMTRDLEVREKSKRSMNWVRPGSLPDPKPEAGYVYRWVRVALQGSPDPGNISASLRGVLDPGRAVDHPEIQLFFSENDRFKDNIVMGGLMLCKAPKELMDSRAEAFQRISDNQMQAVDNHILKDDDPRVKLSNTSSHKVTFGKGA